MTAAFLWGKLPGHGDFVARGLSAAERDALDLWLAGSIADARAALGERFDDRYNAAPPWRFAWEGEGGWTAGAMAASVDRVGRRYPLLLARRGVAGGSVMAMAAATEDLIYRALSEGWTGDQLVDAAAAVEAVGDGEWTSGMGWWTVDANGVVAGRIAGKHPAGLMQAAMLIGEGGA